MSSPSPKQYRIGAFISYSTDDSEAAFTICEKLEARGRSCWIAERDVRAGRDYGEEIINAIDDAACVVLVFSAASNVSAFVKREIERAASKNKPILAVMIEKVKPSPGLELFISSCQWVNATNGRLASHMDTLSEEIGNVEAATNEAKVSRENYQKMRKAKKRRKMLVNVFLSVAVLAVLGTAGFALVRRQQQEAVPISNKIVSQPQEVVQPPVAEVPEKPSFGKPPVDDKKPSDTSLADKPPQPPVTNPEPAPEPPTVPLPMVSEQSLSMRLADRRNELRELIDEGKPEKALELLNSTVDEFPPPKQWKDLVELTVQAIKTKILTAGELVEPPKVAEGVLRLAGQENEIFPEAIELYGMALLNGIGVDKDPEAGFEYLSKAARHDRVPAMYALGVCYMNGDGTGKDSQQASNWFERVLDSEGWGEPQNRAANAYGVLNHEQGKGITTKNKKVYHYVSMAAKNGSLQAQAKQAIMLINGDGVAEDELAGLSLLEDASEKYDVTSMNLLADVLSQGKGDIKKDPAKAKKLRADAEEVVKRARMAAQEAAEKAAKNSQSDKKPL